MTTRPKPYCAAALAWLRARCKEGHRECDLAPLTGQDRRALEAIAHCWELYSLSDEDGRAAALVAIRALLDAMQPTTRHLAREMIAQTFDWDSHERLWPMVAEAP